MRPNTIKRLHQQGKEIVNGWVTSDSPYLAEVMGHAGFDSVVVDLQHGMIGYESALAIFQALSATPAIPLARVAANDPALIMQLVDSGAYGLICPLIANVHDVERFVSACRYPPQGSRSFGPARGLLYGGPDYFERANEEILTFALIETAAALEQIDAILAVPGLDGVYVGPNDLALSLGLPPKAEPDHPTTLAALGRIAAAARKAGKVAGSHVLSPKGTAQRRAEGFTLLTPGNDVAMISQAARSAVAQLRSGT
jgi:4-hydroxy-2-oxoheptanedioate aldolase